jgi:hypothetical protein
MTEQASTFFKTVLGLDPSYVLLQLVTIRSLHMDNDSPVTYAPYFYFSYLDPLLDPSVSLIFHLSVYILFFSQS